MTVDKKNKTAGILLAVTSGIIGLLITPVFSKIVDPLFNTIDRALLTGFVLFSLVLMISIIIFKLYTDNQAKQMERFEQNLIETSQLVNLSISLNNIGLKEAIVNHSVSNLENYCHNSVKEINFLGTYFGSVQQLPEEIFKAAKNGIKVRILLLNPKGRLIEQRLRDLGLPEKIQLHKDAFKRLHVLIKRNNPPEENFKVHFYDRIPPFTLYQFDDLIMLGFLWHGQSSVVGPHLVVEKPTTLLGSFVKRTFEEIWESSIDSGILKTDNQN